MVIPTELTSHLIRRARPDDARHIEALYRELIGDAEVRVLPARIAQVADDPYAALLVLESGGVLRASALVNLCADVMFGSQPFAVVENNVVDATCRGQGWGTALLRWIEEDCKDRGCSKIMLLSSVERSEAHRFFMHCGFSDSKKKGFIKYRRDFR